MSATEVLSALDRIHGTVSVIGSMNADYTVTAQRLPGPGETITGGPLQLLPGGKSGNQAAAAARIGATVQMFGAVGSDSNADFLLGALGEAGVNTTHVRRVLGPSGTTVITVDATGENTIVYSPGSNAQVTVDYVESVRDALARSSVLGLCLESPIETVTAAARMCHEAGVKVLLNDSPFTPSLPSDWWKHPIFCSSTSMRWCSCSALTSRKTTIGTVSIGIMRWKQCVDSVSNRRS